MANYIGGDILEIVCKHPTIGEIRFQPKSGESFNIDAGGFRSGDDAQAVTGSGAPIRTINNSRWSVEGPIAVDPLSGNELKNLPLLSASPVSGTWTITHISGKIWKGLGFPVGDLVIDASTAQMTLKISGGGKLEEL